MTKQLILYGLFAAPAAISLLTLQVYLPAYLTQSTTLSLTALGFVFLAARLIDTVSDPLIGYLSDRLNSRFGRRKPWIFVGTPLFLLVFGLLVTAQSPSAAQLFLLLSLWYITGTALMVPYYAMGAEISPGQHRFTQFSAARAFFGLVGTLTALLLPALFLPQADDQTTIHFLTGLAALCFIPGTAALLATKRPDHPPYKSPGLFTAYRVFKRGSRFNKLILSQFFNGIGTALPATLFILFVQTILKRPDLTGPLLILYFLSAALAVPLWSRLSKTYGKARCWRIAMVTAALVFTGALFVGPSTLWLFALITLVTGVMAGADLSLPASMLADVVEADSKAEGAPRTAIYFALWGTVGKLTQALAIGLAFPLLDLGGVIQGADTAGAAGSINPTTLVLIYAFLPSALKLLAVWSLQNIEKDEN